MTEEEIAEVTAEEVAEVIVEVIFACHQNILNFNSTMGILSINKINKTLVNDRTELLTSLYKSSVKY